MQAPYPLQDAEPLEGGKSGTNVQECRNYESFDIFEPIYRFFSVQEVHQEGSTEASGALGWGIAVTYLDSRHRTVSARRG